MSQLRCVLVCQFTLSFSTSELGYKCFSYNEMFFMTLGLHYFVVRLHYVWKYRCNYVSFLFVIVTYFSLRRNYVIYLFDVVTFFDDVRITLYFGTFELCTEITLENGHFLVTFVWKQKLTKKDT